MLYKEEKVNLLIGLLRDYGVEHVVLCPGSRNAIIVNNMVESRKFRCHPVTDERSAGFFALGLAMNDTPVAIVVTSGSALLNVAPAVVEAYYQHLPLVVISADRPQEDIGQNVGQTMRQYGALANYVRCSVNLTDAMRDNLYYHNRLINEAMHGALAGCGGPVHINVPLPDPSECEMAERVDFSCGEGVRLAGPRLHCGDIDYVLDEFFAASRPMLVLGQAKLDLCYKFLSDIKRHVVVLSEPLSDPDARPYAGIIGTMPDSMLPDCVIYVGGSTVCRSIYERFAAVPRLKVWRVGEEGDFASPFKHLSGVVRCLPDEFLFVMCKYMERKKIAVAKSFYDEWERAFRSEQERLSRVSEDELSAAATVRYFVQQLDDLDFDFHLFYGNSTPVRLACQYACGRKIWCNRGVNGIEGCVSTAAGFSAAYGETVFCVVGDLSFFYDQNALWNSNLNGELRIILLNDRHGGIFDKVKGLEDCRERDRYIAGRHAADARGICAQNDVGYLSAKTVEEMRIGVVTLLTAESERPMLLEVDLGN